MDNQKIFTCATGEMAQQLRACTALVENLSSAPVPFERAVIPF